MRRDPYERRPLSSLVGDLVERIDTRVRPCQALSIRYEQHPCRQLRARASVPICIHVQYIQTKSYIHSSQPQSELLPHTQSPNFTAHRVRAHRTRLMNAVAGLIGPLGWMVLQLYVSPRPAVERKGDGSIVGA
jgi:hypothetical protein